MEQSALTTPVLNLNSTAVEIPLTFKQDEISEEVSYTGFVPVELPYYIDSDDAIVKRTTQRPKRSKRPKKRRRKKTTTTQRPNYNNYDYYDDYENEIPDKESPKQDVGSDQNLGFFVSLLNFFGMFGDHYTDYDTGEASSRLDSMTLPAELTMGVIGLYGLYFAAVGWDLSNRRKKRSLQGLLEDDASSRTSSCNLEYNTCTKLNQRVNIRSRDNSNMVESEAWIRKCLVRKHQCEKNLAKFFKGKKIRENNDVANNQQQD